MAPPAQPISGKCARQRALGITSDCAGGFFALCYSPDMEKKGVKPDKTALRIECVCLLREFAKKPFSQIDTILGLSPGVSRETYEKHLEAYQSWTKKYAAEALQRYYRDQITVLEVVSRSAPKAVKLWADMLEDPMTKPADQERAAKAILEWTKVYISSKDKAGVREMIPKELLEAHDQAVELGGHLERALGSALDLDSKESN